MCNWKLTFHKVPTRPSYSLRTCRLPTFVPAARSMFSSTLSLCHRGENEQVAVSSVSTNMPQVLFNP
jgi:hypothetical protein